MLTSRSFTGILGKDIEKKNVKTQKVKLIHKMSQRPEISRRFIYHDLVANIIGTVFFATNDNCKM